MYLVLVLIPLINSILLGFAGRYIGRYGVILLTVFFFAISLLLLIFICYEVLLLHSVCEIKLWKWLLINEIFLQFGLLFDPISTIMCLVVFIVSFMVHIYSFDYMENDPHFIRFIMFLSLFTFFMILTVTANNFVQLFFGWECVGLASYLLISFWYTRIQASKSALKAIIVNKIGDLAILCAIISIFYLTKSFNYLTIFNYLLYSNYNCEVLIFDMFNVQLKWNCLILINLFLLIGCIAKSAQIGLHTWLADAMEGPTPVSALLHAATMVTVGVFCLIRCNNLFILTPRILLVVIIIGLLTALFGGALGLYQNDIKRIIAYSTCSQLGYMFCACGLTYQELALYHLTNHAFFKALLFLTAGAVIHFYKGWQDIRMMGDTGVSSYVRIFDVSQDIIRIGDIRILDVSKFNYFLSNKVISLTNSLTNKEMYIYFLFGSISLMGVPFFSGFFSKDLIIELSLVNNIFFNYNLYIYTILILAAFFTSFYSLRLLYIVFINIYKFKLVEKCLSLNYYNYNKFINKNDNIFLYFKYIINSYTRIPLIVLVFFSVISGWLFKDFFIGFGTDSFEGGYFIAHYINFSFLIIDCDLLPFIIKFLPIFLLLIVFYLLFFKYYYYKFFILKKDILVYKNSFDLLVNDFNFEGNLYFEKKLFFDVIYYKIFINPVFVLSYDVFYKNIDRGFFEIFGPVGLTKKFYNLSILVDFLHKNTLYYFLMYFIQNILFLLFLCYLFFFLDEKFILINDFFVFIFVIYYVYNINLEKKNVSTC